MKVLLAAINAKYIHSNLAVYSLLGYAKDYKEHIELAEYTINNHIEDIMRDIFNRTPDVLAFSCYIWNIGIIRELIGEIKKVLPNTKIWVGGPEVSYEVERLMQDNLGIDGVMLGEGEQTFLELMEYFVDGKRDLENILGIAYRGKAKIKINKQRPPLPLNDIPFPYEDLDLFENKIIYYESSRGCPFSCSYCLSSVEKGIRFRDIELVKKELQMFIDKKIPQVKFIDRTFNCNHDHAMEIWKYIIEHDNGVTNFHFEISADLLKEEELDLLNTMREGLVQLEIGVQSTNLQTISAINRTMNLEKLAYGVERVRQGNNIHQHLDLIAGLPWEDYESFRLSFNQVYKMKPNQLQLGFLKVLKGSPMYEKKKQYEILYRDYAPYEVLATKWLPYDKVLELKNIEEMVEVYYNSGQFENSLEFLMHYYESPFEFYKGLGAYTKANEQNGQQHSRITRYYRLRAHVEATKPQLLAPLEELLIYDLYLRENLKSRPDFAKSLNQWKEAYHEFYKEREEENKYSEHGILKDYKGFQARQMARMTHIEPFTYDLQLLLKGKIEERKHHILFDYKNVSKLNGNSLAIRLDFV